MVGLGQEGVPRGWGDCLKYLKRGGTEKKGGETKILKKGGGSKLGQGVGDLKNRGAGTPLRTMRLG